MVVAQVVAQVVVVAVVAVAVVKIPTDAVRGGQEEVIAEVVMANG